MLAHAWRNIWRNARRTWITVAATAMSTGLMVATYCLMDGMMAKYVMDAVDMVTGDAQVHAKGWLADRDIYKVVADPERVLRAAGSAGLGAVERSYGFGLVSNRMKSAGASFWGIDPEAEARWFTLASRVEKGAWLNARPRRGMVLGKRLAKSLDARVGSEIVAVVQASDGSMGNELFTVTGILAMAGDSIDRGAAIIHRGDLRDLFVSGRVHEVAIAARGKLDGPGVRAALAGPAGRNELKTWKELNPMLSDMIEFGRASLWLFGSIFFLASALGVMNTMLMATYERVREFGILKALGTSPLRIVRDIELEALMLGLVSTAIGAAGGGLLSWYLSTHGLNTAQWGVTPFTSGGMVFDPLWKGRLSVTAFVGPVVVMWVTCLLAALYPAVKAARIVPVKAIGHV
jgi:ABC-type lipoprotein release transport system permease subunit